MSDRVYVQPRSVDEELGEEEEEEEEDEKIPEEESEVGADSNKFRGATATPEESSKKYEVIGTTSDPEVNNTCSSLLG